VGERGAWAWQQALFGGREGQPPVGLGGGLVFERGAGAEEEGMRGASVLGRTRDPLLSINHQSPTDARDNHSHLAPALSFESLQVGAVAVGRHPCTVSTPEELLVGCKLGWLGGWVSRLEGLWKGCRRVVEGLCNQESCCVCQTAVRPQSNRSQTAVKQQSSTVNPQGTVAPSYAPPPHLDRRSMLVVMVVALLVV